jgi:hypothetical protein
MGPGDWTLANGPPPLYAQQGFRPGGSDAGLAKSCRRLRWRRLRATFTDTMTTSWSYLIPAWPRYGSTVLLLSQISTSSSQVERDAIVLRVRKKESRMEN